MTKKTFSIDQIESYQKLKKRQRQLVRWSESIADEMAKLERQKRHQEDELKEINKQIKSKFAGLDKHEELFVLEQAKILTDSVKAFHAIVGAKYITHDQKELLLERCISEYKALNPESQNLPFKWLKQHLATKYEIECRSVSQFFKDTWEGSEFEGGNKNRSLVLED
ncbi:hypothetical protein N9Z38_02990 [Mariniblastus sp.]|nr:hypothetical protein [Mariniblastus sp.]